MPKKQQGIISLFYDNQNPDGCAIGIVGKSTNEPVSDDESLEAKSKQLDSMILTEEEKALKDYTDVFVTYSITE